MSATELVGYLESDDPEVRYHAALGLANRVGIDRADVEIHVEVIARHLQDDEPLVQVICAGTLAKLGERLDELPAAFDRAMRHYDYRVRLQACYGVGNHPDVLAKSHSLLRRGLRDPDQIVRGAAVEVTGKIRPLDDEEMVESILAILVLSESIPGLQKDCLDCLEHVTKRHALRVRESLDRCTFNPGVVAQKEKVAAHLSNLLD